MQGKAWIFGDSISTDLIAPGRYYHLRSNMPELAKHTLEDADPDFAPNVQPGDFVVAGQNFGLGSSREHAPAIIKLCGVGAVLAKSFARIFFRNAINVGLPAIQCDTGRIEAGDQLDVSLEDGVVRNLTKGFELTFEPWPEAMQNILADGGLAEHVIKHGDLKM